MASADSFMKTPTIRLILFAVVSLLSQPGCAPLRSTEWLDGEKQPSKNAGQIYFLPKAKIRMVGVAQDKGGYQVTISREMEPDRIARYYVQHQGNWFYEDGIVLEINAAGLLQGEQKADAKDKLPATLVSLGASAVSVLQIGASGILSARAPGQTKLENFDVTFSPGDLEDVRFELGKAGFELKGSAMHSGKGSAPALAMNRGPVGADGLYYRPLTTYEFTLKAKGNYEAFSRNVSVAVPNPAEVALLQAKRIGFADVATKGTFDGGQLKKVEITQTSPVLAVVTVPQTILAGVATAIGGIFGNRSSARADAAASQSAASALALAKMDNERKTTEAELAMVKAQIELLQKRQDLGDARALNSAESARDATQQELPAGAETLSTSPELEAGDTPTPQAETAESPEKEEEPSESNVVPK